MNEIQFRYQIQISYLRSLPHQLWPQPAQARVTSTSQDERPASNTFLSHSCFKFLPAGSFDWYDYFLFGLDLNIFISREWDGGKKSIVRVIINFKNSNECWHLLWALVIDCSGLGWIIQSNNEWWECSEPGADWCQCSSLTLQVSMLTWLPGWQQRALPCLNKLFMNHSWCILHSPDLMVSWIFIHSWSLSRRISEGRN